MLVLWLIAIVSKSRAPGNHCRNSFTPPHANATAFDDSADPIARSLLLINGGLRVCGGDRGRRDGVVDGGYSGLGGELGSDSMAGFATWCQSGI
ncbi:hypothetical protein BDZ45DRAFT_478118 [Acephala macrosclerotiorum]|nr:hypothetical protein BDZ45DRAFT_478118 [Acephala macrosclerotiorum]